MEENQVATFEDNEVMEMVKSATKSPVKKAMLVGLLFGLEARVETQEQEKTA